MRLRLKAETHSSRTFKALLGPLLLAFAICPFAQAQTQDDERRWASMDLEELMKVQITSVSKHEQKLWNSAAAIFVISKDDIRDSGATNIPDLLRMVPGLDVAQLNANAWAITARGFNSHFANELLVMVDGRTVYVPSFGGVFWDVINVPLEDIERIEVIRGPGASIWGSNAVNGVVNIITKKAKDSAHQLVSATVGNPDRESGLVQVAGHVRELADFRFFAKYLNEGQLEESDGTKGADNWHILSAGMRADIEAGPADTVTVSGDIYSGLEGLPVEALPSVISPVPVPANYSAKVNGGFGQVDWTHQQSTRSSYELNVIFDRYYRFNQLSDHRQTGEIDFQHNLSISERNQLTWGLQYRHSSSDTDGSATIQFVPASTDVNVYSGFVQEELALRPDKLFLTLGVRLEKPAYSNFVALPNVRLAWATTPRTTVWTAFSRSVRTPADSDVKVKAYVSGLPPISGIPAVLVFEGNPNLKAEGAYSYQIGARHAWGKRLTASATAYFSSYDNQITAEPGTPFAEASPLPPHIVVPLIGQNLMHGETHGLEAFASWKVTNWWKISPGYAFERIHMHLAASSVDTSSAADAEGSSPVHSAQLRSHVVLPANFSWDVSAYFVDRIVSQAIPSYTRVDTQLSWEWRRGLTVSAVGQNLFSNDHLEFLDTNGSVRSTLMPRTGFVRIAWRSK